MSMSSSLPTAVVTGASSGLGKAVATQLAQQGMHVFALARSIDAVEFPENVTKITCNIRDLNSIDEAFSQIDAKTQKIDFLVNCAGRALMKPLEETTREEIMDTFGVNLKGNIYIAQEVYKRMLLEKSGHIINVSSTSGIRAREMETIYCASKWGLRGFTESLRLEARPRGIKVTGVYPGGMRSENFWKVDPGRDITAYMTPESVAGQIVHILTESKNVAVAELVIERP